MDLSKCPFYLHPRINMQLISILQCFIVYSFRKCTNHTLNLETFIKVKEDTLVVAWALQNIFIHI